MAMQEAVEVQHPSIAWEENAAVAGKSVYLGPVVQGYYIEKKEGVGANESNIYNIELASGEVYAIWGTTVLDPKMDIVPLGSEVRITYLGTVKAKVPGRKPYKTFKVEYDESARTTRPMKEAASDGGAQQPAPVAGNAAKQPAPAPTTASQVETGGAATDEY